jgi:hypothetical protein
LRSGAFHELDDAGKGGRLVDGCVFPNEPRRPVHRRPQQVSITGAFIHTQVRAVGGMLHERQALLGQHLLEATQMRRFVVGNDAIDADNNGADHDLASRVRLVKPM